MILALSEHTKQLEPCTIQKGVVGHDKKRRFAVADIDLIMEHADSEFSLPLDDDTVATVSFGTREQLLNEYLRNTGQPHEFDSVEARESRILAHQERVCNFLRINPNE